MSAEMLLLKAEKARVEELEFYIKSLEEKLIIAKRDGAILEAALQVAREFISYSTCLCIGGEFPVECKRCTTLARIGEVSRD